jgi:hypothetical protein
MVYALSFLIHINDKQSAWKVNKTVNNAGYEIWLGSLCVIVGCLTPDEPIVNSAT